MSSVNVAGAELFYESFGSGPPLIMIPGATGTADSFRIVAHYLSRRFTVVVYDRRGFSRSRLWGVQDYERRLETEADDVRALIERVAGGPAIVVGASAGGIVALEVMVRHPDMVRAVIPLEPPAMRHLPGGQSILDFLLSVYDLYHSNGADVALQKWRQGVFAFTPHEAKVMARAEILTESKRSYSDTDYWFEHELRQYPAVKLDLDALASHVGCILLAVGRESAGYPSHEVTLKLAKDLDAQVVKLPGGHSGYVTEPGRFAVELFQRLVQEGFAEATLESDAGSTGV